MKGAWSSDWLLHACPRSLTWTVNNLFSLRLRLQHHRLGKCRLRVISWSGGSRGGCEQSARKLKH